MNKSWHTEDEIGFQNADGVFFEKPKAKKETDIEEPVEQEATKDEPYKRPDYKKRYDDLKKHYDSKLNEFKLDSFGRSKTILLADLSLLRFTFIDFPLFNRFLLCIAGPFHPLELVSAQYLDE